MKNSKIILARGIKLDRNYNNVLSYTNEQMLSLLRETNHLIYEDNDYSFINEFQNIICVQVPYGNCIDLNYMAFQNPRYNNKWFFCFVDSIEYNSEKSTNIKFHVDSWTTWYEEKSIKTCYVLREHVEDDTIGLHTIDEGLDVGEVISEGILTDTRINANHYICVSTNWNPATRMGFTGTTVYNRTVWGTMIAVFPMDNDGIEELKWFIQQTNTDGRPDDIRNIFIAPSIIFNNVNLITANYDVYVGDQIVHENATFKYIASERLSNDNFAPLVENITIDKHYNFTGISIRNNKCFCYPYNYLLVTNNAGNVNLYKYEDFSTSNCVFSEEFALSIGISGRSVPRNYKGLNENVDESITCSKFPTCQWSSDSYTNWLTQNAVNIEKQNVNIGFTGVKAATGIVGNLLTGNIGGALISGIDSAQSLSNQIMDLQGGFYQAKLLPEQVGGTADGDVNFASLDTGFKYINMRVKNEYMRLIDGYFDKFGYKVLEIKQPNILSRSYWNYLQVGAGEIFATGNIPQADLETINAIVQKGVTIWHNHNSIGNYNLINDIAPIG